jgi:glycopeptide antibiotics resistance protein/uncharacterized RDD family membrane protein YckC
MFFYLQCAFYVVILPLPDPATVMERKGPFCQLVPFQNVLDFLEKSSFDIGRPATWLGALRESYFLEPLFNIILTIPFGVYLSYWFKRRLRGVAILSFLLSLFFELTQLTGLFWIYPNPYRIFDVNDLIMNTLGGVLGYFICTRFFGFLPGKERIDRQSAVRSGIVSYTRRVFALFVDEILLWIVSALIGMFTRDGTNDVYQLVFFLYFPVIAIILRGGTPGKRLVKTKIDKTGAGGPPLSLRIVLRYALRNAPVLFFLSGTGSLELFAAPHPQWFVILQLLLIVFVLIDWLIGFRRGRRLWYEIISGTRNVSTFAADNGDGENATDRTKQGAKPDDAADRTE